MGLISQKAQEKAETQNSREAKKQKSKRQASAEAKKQKNTKSKGQGKSRVRKICMKTRFPKRIKHIPISKSNQYLSALSF